MLCAVLTLGTGIAYHHHRRHRRRRHHYHHHQHHHQHLLLLFVALSLPSSHEPDERSQYLYSHDDSRPTIHIRSVIYGRPM